MTAPGKQSPSHEFSRVRVMDGDTKEFKTQDYMPPVHSDSTGGAINASDSKFGRAQGFTGAKEHTLNAQKSSDRQDPSHKAIVAVLLVAALLVFLVSFFVIKSCVFTGETPGASEETLVSATNTYVLIATTDSAGEPLDFALCYVDSINGRFECLHSNPLTSYRVDGTDILTLRDVFAQHGTEGLISAINSYSGITMKYGIVVSEETMNSILSLMDSESTHNSYALAQTIMSRDQKISSVALQGLLRTIEDISPENYIDLSAPYAENDGSAQEYVLNQQQWLSMVAGMRNTTSDSRVL